MLFSTGLRNLLLGTSDFATAFATAEIRVYETASVPDSADDALPGDAVLLYTIQASGAALEFEAPSGGVVSKSTSQSWTGTSVAGDAAFFRLVNSSDDGTASTTLPRVQGTVSDTSGDYLVGSTTIEDSATQTIKSFAVSIAAGS